MIQFDGLEWSLDEEFGIPTIKTPTIRKTNDVAKTPRKQSHESRRDKNPIQKLTYDGCVFPIWLKWYSSHVLRNLFSNMNLDNAVDEEMDAHSMWMRQSITASRLMVANGYVK